MASQVQEVLVLGLEITEDPLGHIEPDTHHEADHGEDLVKCGEYGHQHQEAEQLEQADRNPRQGRQNDFPLVQQAHFDLGTGQEGVQVGVRNALEAFYVNYVGLIVFTQTLVLTQAESDDQPLKDIDVEFFLAEKFPPGPFGPLLHPVPSGIDVEIFKEIKMDFQLDAQNAGIFDGKFEFVPRQLFVVGFFKQEFQSVKDLLGIPVTGFHRGFVELEFGIRVQRLITFQRIAILIVILVVQKGIEDPEEFPELSLVFGRATADAGQAVENFCPADRDKMLPIERVVRPTVFHLTNR